MVGTMEVEPEVRVQRASQSPEPPLGWAVTLPDTTVEEVSLPPAVVDDWPSVYGGSAYPIISPALWSMSV